MLLIIPFLKLERVGCSPPWSGGTENTSRNVEIEGTCWRLWEVLRAITNGKRVYEGEWRTWRGCLLGDLRWPEINRAREVIGARSNQNGVTPGVEIIRCAKAAVIESTSCVARVAIHYRVHAGVLRVSPPIEDLVGELVF